MNWHFKNIFSVLFFSIILLVLFLVPNKIINAQSNGFVDPSSGLSSGSDPAPVTPQGTSGQSPAAVSPANLTYQPLVGIPGVSNAASDFGTYINQLYFLSISLAALLAVIKIIIAGVKYMLADVVTSKADAKSDIWGALLGLLLIVSAVIILGTINPNLTNLNVLSGAPALNNFSPTNTTNQVPSVVGGSPINPTMTNNTIQNTIRANTGETVTQAPGGGPIGNQTRIQAESQCSNRSGFTLGYTYRTSEGANRFVQAVPGTTYSSTDMLAIHCTPPITP